MRLTRTSMVVGALGLTLGVAVVAQAQMQKKAVLGAVKAIGPYTPGVENGPFLFLSGQIGLSPTTGNLVEGGTRAEAKQVMENLGAVLKEAGLGYQHVMKTTIYVTDINDFAAVNEVYGSFFPQGSVAPARSTVGVAALPRGAHVEIDFIAMR